MHSESPQIQLGGLGGRCELNSRLQGTAPAVSIFVGLYFELNETCPGSNDFGSISRTKMFI